MKNYLPTGGHRLVLYFYLFLYLYLTRITINNDTQHLKSPKKQNRRAALGRSAIKLLGYGGGGGGGLQLVCGRPTLALSSALVPQTLTCTVCVEEFVQIAHLSVCLLTFTYMCFNRTVTLTGNMRESLLTCFCFV